MSSLDDIRRQLDKANDRIAALEQALKDHPGYPSIAANLESARRVKNRLEAQLKERAAGPAVELTNQNQMVPPGAPAS